MNFAIIVAGGTGQRMKSTIPKQFLELNGKPILCYSIEAFFNAFPEISIIVTLPKDYLSDTSIIRNHLPKSINIQFVAGGETRFHSVQNALNLITLSDNGLVFIHDGVRPFITTSFLQKCHDEAVKYRNAIPCIDLKDSLRLIEENGNTHVDRLKYKIIQTPQVFEIQLIKKSFTVDYNDSFTDDASVIEAYGHSVHLVEGLNQNIKITNPTDLILAEAMLKTGFR